MPKFIIKIDAECKKIINNNDICCYIADKDSPKSILDEAIKTDKLVLSADEDLILQEKLDGVLIRHEVDEKFAKYIKPQQKKYAGKYMGIYCRPSRHEAMIASEAEPDFVIFEVDEQNQSQAQEVIQWYAELFLIQSAVTYFAKIDKKILSTVDFIILNASEYKIVVDKIKRLD